MGSYESTARPFGPSRTIGGHRRLGALLRAGARPAQELTGVGALVGVTELVRGEHDLQKVLALVARTVSETLGFGTVVVNLYRPAWDDFCVATVHGDEDVREALLGSTYDWESWRPLLDDRFLRGGAYFIRQGDFDWSSNSGARYVPDRKVHEHPLAWRPDDEVFVPLYGADDDLLGILSVGDPASGFRPTDDELQLLVGLAGHAANALTAAQAAIVQSRHSAALERLMHISSELTQSLAPASIVQGVCDGIAEALGFQKVCVDLLAGDGDSLVTRAVAGWAEDGPLARANLSLNEISALFDPEFECAGCYLVPNEIARKRLSASQVIYESTSNGRGPHAWNHHWLAIPLHGPAGETVGLIWADEPEDRLLPTEERLQALRVFANQAASALTLATQFEQMRYLADHDPLTQLPNRRAFMRELERALAEVEELAPPLALIVVDVDRLKALNDRRGHAAGDECLVRVGELLRSELRGGETAFRIGGDEFAILLPGSDLESASATSVRLAEALERRSRSSILRVEASFGVAERTRDKSTPDLLLRAADEAMYRAKHERRLAAPEAG